MKEKWKWCPTCKIYTDFDALSCPWYGLKEGHILKEKSLTELGARRLFKQSRLSTKNMGRFEDVIAKLKKPTRK